jgi:hypothetical protein
VGKKTRSNFKTHSRVVSAEKSVEMAGTVQEATQEGLRGRQVKKSEDQTSIMTLESGKPNSTSRLLILISFV